MLTTTEWGGGRVEFLSKVIRAGRVDQFGLNLQRTILIFSIMVFVFYKWSYEKNCAQSPQYMDKNVKNSKSLVQGNREICNQTNYQNPTTKSHHRKHFAQQSAGINYRDDTSFQIRLRWVMEPNNWIEEKCVTKIIQTRPGFIINVLINM